MTPFNREELTALAENAAAPCVSLYMSTGRTVSDALQHHARFRKLVEEAEKELTERGARREETASIMKPIRGLLEDEAFWLPKLSGVAVFAAPGMFRAYRELISFKDQALAGHRFYLLPLLPLVSGPDRFFVLAINMRESRLIEASPNATREIELRGLPADFEATLTKVVKERHVGFRTNVGRVPAGPGRRAASFYGHGGGDEAKRVHLLDYLARIDRAVMSVLRGDRSPLILAAVEYVASLYREVNTHGCLLPDTIEGNPQRIAAGALQKRARPIAEEFWSEERRRAADRYHALAGKLLTSCDVREIVPAAYAGKIETLFVSQGVAKWGKFDATSATVELHEQLQPGDEDLVDHAATETLRHRGRLLFMKPAEMPTSTALAAIFKGP